MTKPYTANPVPGDFEHRGDTCAIHGEGPHWRPVRSVQPYACVQCTLDAHAATEPPPAPNLVVTQLREFEAAADQYPDQKAAPVETIVTVGAPVEVTRTVEPAPPVLHGVRNSAVPDNDCPGCADLRAERDRWAARVAELERRAAEARRVLGGD